MAQRSELSARGKCLDCAQRRQRDEIEQMVTATGPHFRHWQQQCARAFRWVALDENRATP